MILLLDNYDSFVHNLARYFQRLGQKTVVVRNDATDPAAIERLRPQAIVLSPGPCTPAEAGCSIEVVRRFADKVPILGVCLGHQAIGAALGGEVVRAPSPMHGRVSEVHHRGASIFRDLPNPLSAGRYHSLVLRRASLPRELEVTAESDDGAIMAVAHREKPIVGVQFHPESILTSHGFDLLAGFLRIAGLNVPSSRPTAESAAPPRQHQRIPTSPVTF